MDSHSLHPSDIEIIYSENGTTYVTDDCGTCILAIPGDHTSIGGLSELQVKEFYAAVIGQAYSLGYKTGRQNVRREICALLGASFSDQ